MTRHAVSYRRTMYEDMHAMLIDQHACVLHSIVGANCQIGPWARVDGEAEPEKDTKGQISVTVLGELMQ